MKNIKKDFPLLAQTDLIYFDSASTSQKPSSVIEAEKKFYEYHNANIHRGIYPLAENATQMYEDARKKVARFINADAEEIIFTRGTTESINTIALSWGMEHISAGDEIVVSMLEHHANFVPWQELARKKGARLVILPIHDDGTLIYEQLDTLITNKTKIVAISHESNVLGVEIDLSPVVARAHAVGARILIDAAQSVAHQRIDVRSMKCDFLAFSGHKMLGPTGVGVLFIKKELHDQVPPLFTGGGMVFSVGKDRSSWQKAPQKYEAGTPPIAQAIALGTAIDYLSKIDFNALRQHEASLCERLITGLQKLTKVTLYGPIEELKRKGHMVSFGVTAYHAHDVAAYLATKNICVRAGNHCAQPLAERLCVDALVRVSFYLYNSVEDVDCIVDALSEL